MVTGTRLLSHDTRIFAKEYSLLQLIGRGSFGEVWACQDRRTGKRYAVKLIDKSTLRTFAERQEVRREIAILEAFSGKHEGVVKLIEACEGETVIQLVMECCSGGDLFELLKTRGGLPEGAARVLFCQLASALSFCHSHGVVHRDLKPENILLDACGHALYDDVSNSRADVSSISVRLKLADFGLAVVLGPDGEASGYTGSRYYTTPEMLKGLSYGRGADVWSLGVVLCTMLTGRLPFSGTDKMDLEGLRRSILRGRIDFTQPSWSKVSESAKDLIRRMLTVDPESRITADEILLHPWLQPRTPVDPCGPRARATSAAPLHLPGHVSVSLPGSPVAKQGKEAALTCHRPYGSGGTEEMSKFRLCEPQQGAVAAAEKGMGTLPAPKKQEEGATRGQNAAEDMRVDSRAPRAAMFCVSSVAMSELVSAGVCCIPLFLGVLGLGNGEKNSPNRSRGEQEMQIISASPDPGCTRETCGGSPTAAQKCSLSNGTGKGSLALTLGQPHKCLVQMQEFYVH